MPADLQGPYKYKCMYEHCRALSIGTHAVCRMHLRFEVAVGIIVGVLAFVGIAAFLGKFH